MIKIIDTLYYFYFKKEEKEFGRSIWSAIYAAWSFASNLYFSFFIVNGFLINWEPYAKLLFIITSLYVKLLIILSPFVLCTAYFLFRKRYLRIVERPEMYESYRNRIYFKLWVWGTIILGFISTMIGFGIKFGF